MRIIREIRALGPDVALVPHRSFRSALLPLAARVPRRVGFHASGGASLLTDRVPYSAGVHEIERVAALVTPLGIALPEGRLPFALVVPEGAADALARSLRERGAEAGARRLVIAPGSRWATKRWLADRFAAAAGALASELEAEPVIVGSEDDVEVGARVTERAGPRATDLTGILPVSGLLALVSGSALVLSNDSAVAHIAAGLGVPVVAVFGPTVPAQGFSPYTDLSRVVEAGLACRPCGRHGSERCPLGTLECMERVRVEDVVAAALGMLEGGAARA
jgi:heptosyltransferase-2